MSSPSLAIDGARRLASFLARCQRMAGRSTLSADDLRTQIDGVASAIPPALTHDEYFVVRALLVYTLMDVGWSLPGGAGPLPDPLLLRSAHNASDIARLTAAARMLLEAWCAQLAAARGSTNRPPAAAALQVIERRYADPSFRLACVARELNRSISYVVRLLKESTGAGFRQHLHHARIRAAERLLRETSLSVKEVAARVGYQRTNQLDIHFRRQRHSSPTRFRAEQRQAPLPSEKIERIEPIENVEPVDTSSK